MGVRASIWVDDGGIVSVAAGVRERAWGFMAVQYALQSDEQGQSKGTENHVIASAFGMYWRII